MRKISVLLPVILIFLLAHASGGAARTTVSKQIDTIVKSAMTSNNIPGMTIAVARNGAMIFTGAYGYADLEAQRKASLETRFSIASITKQFTAAAILLLAERGRLSLNDPVSKYFPNLTAASGITVRNLLDHTSGYPDYWYLDYSTN